MRQTTDHAIRTPVRDPHGRAALGGSPGEERRFDDQPCCAPAGPVQIDAGRLGYSAHGLDSVRDDADHRLGCDNPVAVASLKPGDIVLDLGSGQGFDAFLAAPVVGDLGRVIGVDTAPEMVATARANADRGGYTNVDFRSGAIEHLPVADASVDVIISSCAINLSSDKSAVFREAFRVLRPGGRLAISDVVASDEVPDEVRNGRVACGECIAGASPLSELADMMFDAGFETIHVAPKVESRASIEALAPGRTGGEFVVSAVIEAVKPATDCC